MHARSPAGRQRHSSAALPSLPELPGVMGTTLPCSWCVGLGWGGDGPHDGAALGDTAQGGRCFRSSMRQRADAAEALGKSPDACKPLGPTVPFPSRGSPAGQRASHECGFGAAQGPAPCSHCSEQLFAPALSCAGPSSTLGLRGIRAAPSWAGWQYSGPRAPWLHSSAPHHPCRQARVCRNMGRVVLCEPPLHEGCAQC